MGNVAALVLYVIEGLLNLLLICIFVWAVMSWLIAFNVVNMRHPAVRTIVHFLDAITRPVMRPVQRIIPPFGGVDISPIIVLLVIQGIITFLIHPAIYALARPF